VISFQSRHTKTFMTKYMRFLNFSFVSNEASVLEYISPIYFPINYVGVVLHACVSDCAPTIQLTILDLSFLEALE
jgi:hypothetical protein